jgi:hypothetical protein
MTRAKGKVDTHREQSEQVEHGEQLEQGEQVEHVAHPAPAAKSDWPKYLKSTTQFGYTDPVTHIHYSPVAPVRIDAAPAVGSWLHTQMAAKLIGEA